MQNGPGCKKIKGREYRREGSAKDAILFEAYLLKGEILDCKKIKWDGDQNSQKIKRTELLEKLIKRGAKSA